ncbi:hypothetical protein [Bacillus badius]|uniref:hypothetical protein n=1 Tax=Bacillus badius TaxID=1455 RepID=UPI00069732F4|nr:hypothetical protein [Bacillus badius]
MDTVDIIQSVERLGAELLPGGGCIRIKKGKYLPNSITARIAEHKQDILTILERDNQAKKAGFLIAIPGQLYTVTLSKISSIYIEHIQKSWEAWRETHYQGRQQVIKFIATGKTLDYVLVKVRNYLEYVTARTK